MSWLTLHRLSEQAASEAQLALLQGRHAEARDLYARAADAEDKALHALDPSKTRTIGISAVSAASLYYKAANLARAEQVAGHWLGVGSLPGFAREQLRGLLQSVSAEEVRRRTDTTFAPGQILVSIKGGEVVYGGAPLDLIVKKAKVIQSFLLRTTEFIGGLAFRKRGKPRRAIWEASRPWLFQAQPGSYQFAVALQEHHELDVRQLPSSEDVSARFLQILRLGVEASDQGLSELVRDADYREIFLKLVHDLAPEGTACDSVEVGSPGQREVIRLDSNVRKNMNRTTRDRRPVLQSPTIRKERLRGLLRAVHLGQDWLELAMDRRTIRVNKVGDQADDLIGPLVNKPVVVHTTVYRTKDRDWYEFLDIEPEE